ncbi:type I restriction enzyme, S subunit [Caloramator quimbayensis]|uniref:Type I restriction enzyme, S subunit n=1 Tax=Caloramator quimbayensis TaxID=1147123 RepID=A0A1T4X0F0_9CLOT|nr:restriction endonuclease subunit S [Caloramator quimbayensis]SKA83034.1 type I restriction enzyme, S subunit [Caloramator quimbayensis]
MKEEIRVRLEKIKRGEVPEGYKKTSVGIIPKDWENIKLKKIIKSLDAGVSVNSEDIKSNHNSFGILKTSCIANGKFYPSENKKIIDSELSRAKLNPQKGSILISRMNTPDLVGEVGYVDENYKNLFIPDRLWQTTYKEKVEGKWLVNLLISEKIKKQIKNIATGTSNSMKNISKDNFLLIEIPYTCLVEQQKIAQILSTWDKAIELKEKLIEYKKEYKKGLMQNLLSGKVRFPGFNDDWIKVELGKALSFIKKEPVKNPENYYLLTVKLHVKGIEATNKKPNITEKGRPYFVREPKELLIGRQNFHNGGIGIVPEGMTGFIASNAISSLCAKKGILEFYFYYLSNERFYKKIESIVGGTGQKEISESMLKKIKVIIPKSEEEKQAIANILSKADKEIELLEKELEALKKQKEGLMQLLLTGIIRVN